MEAQLNIDRLTRRLETLQSEMRATKVNKHTERHLMLLKSKIAHATKQLAAEQAKLDADMGGRTVLSGVRTVSRSDDITAALRSYMTAAPLSQAVGREVVPGVDVLASTTDVAEARSAAAEVSKWSRGRETATASNLRNHLPRILREHVASITHRDVCALTAVTCKLMRSLGAVWAPAVAGELAPRLLVLDALCTLSERFAGRQGTPEELVAVARNEITQLCATLMQCAAPELPPPTSAFETVALLCEHGLLAPSAVTAAFPAACYNRDTVLASTVIFMAPTPPSPVLAAALAAAAQRPTWPQDAHETIDSDAADATLAAAALVRAGAAGAGARQWLGEMARERMCPLAAAAALAAGVQPTAALAVLCAWCTENRKDRLVENSAKLTDNLPENDHDDEDGDSFVVSDPFACTFTIEGSDPRPFLAILAEAPIVHLAARYSKWVSSPAPAGPVAPARGSVCCSALAPALRSWIVEQTSAYLSGTGATTCLATMIDPVQPPRLSPRHALAVAAAVAAAATSPAVLNRTEGYATVPPSSTLPGAVVELLSRDRAMVAATAAECLRSENEVFELLTDEAAAPAKLRNRMYSLCARCDLLIRAFRHGTPALAALTTAVTAALMVAAANKPGAIDTSLDVLLTLVEHAPAATSSPQLALIVGRGSAGPLRLLVPAPPASDAAELTEWTVQAVFSCEQWLGRHLPLVLDRIHRHFAPHPAVTCAETIAALLADHRRRNSAPAFDSVVVALAKDWAQLVPPVRGTALPALAALHLCGHPAPATVAAAACAAVDEIDLVWDDIMHRLDAPMARHTQKMAKAVRGTIMGTIMPCAPAAATAAATALFRKRSLAATKTLALSLAPHISAAAEVSPDDTLVFAAAAAAAVFLVVVTEARAGGAAVQPAWLPFDVNEVANTLPELLVGARCSGLRNSVRFSPGAWGVPTTPGVFAAAIASQLPPAAALAFDCTLVTPISMPGRVLADFDGVLASAEETRAVRAAVGGDSLLGRALAVAAGDLASA